MSDPAGVDRTGADDKTPAERGPVRVFISYAHDDPVHENRVRAFWLFLRAHGIDARIDLPAAEHRQDWAEWMTQEVRNADRVLVIASPGYRRRAEGDAGPDEGRGLQWEARLIRERFYADQKTRLGQVLPVVLPGCSADDIPMWLGPTSATRYTVSEYTVRGAEGLLRLLTGQPRETDPPPLGTVPELPPHTVEVSMIVSAGITSGTTAVVPAATSKNMRRQESGAAGVTAAPIIRWVHGGTPADCFSGRAEELSQLHRWARVADINVIGVTAWGGAGKTALITELIERSDIARMRSFRGLYAWSFYEDPVVEHWARTLLSWVSTNFDLRPQKGELPVQILEVLRKLPLLLVLDGLEVIQEGPAHADFGRLLDGVLRATLIGMCLMENSGLALLTSRFQFADLEHFDGGAARMLDVPPLASEEGAELLRQRGVGWLSRHELIDLVDLVDGHALAVTVLAAVLRKRLPTADLILLHDELRAANRTDARVTKVLHFYASRLSAADRTFISIVSLFQQPIEVRAILSLGSHSYLGNELAGWNATTLELACHQRLAGLVTWHADGLVSAHPLVRDVFRAFILNKDTAQLATEVTLNSLPNGPVSSTAEAQRIVEVIELLLDSGQFSAARSLYTARTRNGRIWMQLPAARLGRRCAMAFLQSQIRRPWMPEQDLGFFSNEAGLFALHAGDIGRAEKFLRDAAAHYNSVGAYDAEAVTSRNLARCLAYHGRTIEAREVASTALKVALNIDNKDRIRNARSNLAWIMDLSGDIESAKAEFQRANAIQNTLDQRRLYAIDGTWWADLLLRSGDIAPAQDLAASNLAICQEHSWNADVGRCYRLLGRCDTVARRLDSANVNLQRAAAIFRDGDYLVELAETFSDMAECHRLAADLDEGERICTEAIVALAGPRELIPALARNLGVRARIRIDQHIANKAIHSLDRARDDADHCLRLATKVGHLPWLELLALEAYSIMEYETKAGDVWSARFRRQSERLGVAGDVGAKVAGAEVAGDASVKVAGRFGKFKGWKARRQSS